MLNESNNNNRNIVYIFKKNFHKVQHIVCKCEVIFCFITASGIAEWADRAHLLDMSTYL